MAGKCSISVCNRDEYSSYDRHTYHGRCIFHCDKSNKAGWGNPESEDVKRFWSAIREQVKTEVEEKAKEHNFDNYIFPAFENFSEHELIFDKKVSKVSFVNADFIYPVNFQNVSFTIEAIFDNAKFHGNTNFNKSVFTDSSFFHTRFEEKVYFDDIQCQHIRFYNTFFAKRFTFSLKKDALAARIEFCNVFFEKEATVAIEHIKCNRFNLAQINTQSPNIKLADIEIVDNLNISNCMLDKTEFNGFDLRSCKKISLENVSFIGAHLTNVKWGKINESRFRKNDREPIDRQMARQLKAINDAQGETVIANDFYALEMKLRSKELEWKWGQIGEKIVQNIHGLISNHSNDWALSSIWFVAFAMLLSSMAIPFDLDLLFGLFSLLAILFGITFASEMSTKQYYIFAITFFVWNLIFFTATYPDISYLVAFVNPLGVKESHFLLEHISLFWLYIGRLIEVFIGYQIITAIRKNTRRK